ncbi:DUF427 domain-containing protein [Streptomyces sp. NPDC002574]|uniref:DUF427 domain-containing protein n=1 Tax=Streptomyces sp. NPDC002574 TaxID=3364652 RepID=UPI0036B93235
MPAPKESVREYPRPPAVEAVAEHVRVEYAGRVVADTRSAFRVLETSHPPVYYLPPDAVSAGLLRPAALRTLCEWKGQAAYWDLVAGGRISHEAAWSCPRPRPGYEEIAGFLAFHPSRVDRCLVDGETVVPQPGGFYGGWITSRVTGPFKGAAGTEGW